MRVPVDNRLAGGVRITSGLPWQLAVLFHFRLKPRPGAPHFKYNSTLINHSARKVRVTKYLLTLKKLAEWLDKDFDATGREDLERLVNSLENKKKNS